MKRCPHCDSILKKNSKFCPECGMTVISEEIESVTFKKKKTKRKYSLVVGLVIAALTVFFAFGGVKLLGEIFVSTIDFSDNPSAISAASQSVVKLNCYSKNGEMIATGSGFACFADNVIVTNYHVIDDGVFSIEASTEDGHTFDIPYVLATEEAKDIAILATAVPHNLELLHLGDSGALQKGEKVVAIGSPLGLLNSVSTGVFSGYVDENGMNVLQFTASISSGSSGGALFNNAGEVLGITFASFEEGQNLNLAVPIGEAAHLYNNMGEAIAFRDWYQKTNAGYEYFLESQFVEYDELVSNPNRYHGELISVIGYASETEEQLKAANGNTYNRIYLLPDISYKKWKDEPTVLMHGTMEMEGYFFYWFETPFEESLMIKCDDITHSISVNEYTDDYLIVTGIFSYTDELPSIDLLYVRQK